MGLFFLLSILIRVLLGHLYRHMIRETDNMATTGNKLLKQCKLKFTNCYQMNKGMPNIAIFVDKFLSRLTLGPISFEILYHLSEQLMLLSIVSAGVGVCGSIFSGKMLGEILPFYVVSFLELYIYFSISSLVDVKNLKNMLKINLVDYLENHLSARIGVTDKDMEKLYGKPLQLMPIGKENKAASGGSVQTLGEGWSMREGKMAEAQSERKRVVQETAQAATQAEQPDGFTKDQEKELENLLTEFLTFS